MSTNTLHIDIVSAEKAMYSGDVAQVIATGEAGELGITPGHTALITTLKPGEIHLFHTDGTQEIFFVSGGIFEVQPHLITVLADAVERAEDLDEMVALEAKERAEKMMVDKSADIDYGKVAVELAEAMAQLRAISKMRDKLKL
jgi:F-type H+-transporting ATPase subunit epsilon